MNMNVSINMRFITMNCSSHGLNLFHFHIVVDQVSDRPAGHRPRDDDHCFSQQLQK